MKTLYPLLLVLLFLTGCATSSTHTEKVEAPQKHYIGILTLVGNISEDFSRLDSASYETHIRGKFNNLELPKYRSHLENTLQQTLSERAQTRVVRSSDVFKINADVSYAEFLDVVKQTGVETILFVNLRSFWHTYSLSTDTNFLNKPEPNALFHSYLIDTQTLEPVWYAQSVVNGVYAYYETLNNTFARQLYRNLRRDKYILVPAEFRYRSSYSYQQD
jgi:hypothetical protein